MSGFPNNYGAGFAAFEGRQEPGSHERLMRFLIDDTVRGMGLPAEMASGFSAIGFWGAGRARSRRDLIERSRSLNTRLSFFARAYRGFFDLFTGPGSTTNSFGPGGLSRRCPDCRTLSREAGPL
jgi:hypothetical protein